MPEVTYIIHIIRHVTRILRRKKYYCRIDHINGNKLFTSQKYQNLDDVTEMAQNFHIHLQDSRLMLLGQEIHI